MLPLPHICRAFSRFGLAACLAIVLLSPASIRADAENTVKFQIDIINLSKFDLSPGGYVVHNDKYELFRFSQPASKSVRSLCESGKTPDFLFHLKDNIDLRSAFTFHGGSRSLSSSRGFFKASPAFPLLSFVHKVSFTDDTCVGRTNIDLFDAEGHPKTLQINLISIDVGSRENIRIKPPRTSLARSLSGSGWKFTPTRPPRPVQPSPLFRRVIATASIAPLTPG